MPVNIGGSVYVEGSIDSSMFSIHKEENQEYIKVEIDKNDKILGYTGKDGSHYLYNLKSESIDDVNESIDDINERIDDLPSLENFENIEDIEGRHQITKDSQNKITSYRKYNGTLVEPAGIETTTISLSQDGINKLSSELNIPEPDKFSLYKAPNLPKFGTTNVKQETFYLTADPRVHSIDDVVPIQDFEDTTENARNRMQLAHYYIKSTLTDNGDGTYSINAGSVRLAHYGSGKVKLNTQDNKYYANDPITKIGGICYYTDTLVYSNVWVRRDTVLQGYTRVAPDDPTLAEGATKNTLVEVVQIIGAPCVDAWQICDWDWAAIDGTDIGKKIGHNCICDVDFGEYFSGTNIAVEIKHQGNSTMFYRKKNFRYTFYKNSTFAKKNKIKIGEMLRLSGYNLKANAIDETKIKELILYRIFTQLWQNRPITDRYDWDNEVNGLYCGATGNIQGFPIVQNFNDTFYGIHTFCIKKDEKNYMLGGEDEDGIFISGSTNGSNCWGRNLPYNISGNYDEEMLDEMSESTIAAMTTWHHFINNRLYKGADNNEYNSTQLEEVSGTMYVRSTLVPGENSVTVVQTEDMAYRGSDGNLYILSELTESGGVLYVTATMEDEHPVTATALGRHIYQGSDGNRYLSSDTEVIDGTRYVTALIDWETTESSISATLIEFNRKNIPDRLDVLGFIDYFICLQVFYMVDNTHNNILIYSNSEKKKMFPFFYDLDGTMGGAYDSDVFVGSLASDMSLWEHFKEIYLDDIINRYSYLRGNVLSMDNITAIYEDIRDNIPEEALANERTKWGSSTRKDSFDPYINKLIQRLEYIDEKCFDFEQE